MIVSRRALLAAFLFPAAALSACAEEPFKINTSEAKDVNFKFQRREMEYATNEPVGTLVIDGKKRFMYHVMPGGMAMRYGVAVGKSAKAWTGEVIIKKKAEWPTWTPTPYHLEQQPTLIKWKDGMPGGLDNPMGARALYLFKGDVDTINRIHGSAKPKEIGQKATAGCIGMLNVDIVHLYANVEVGTRVVMLG
jgi:lipoprotein-anchoring transpeptidase ErfK/SrfK